VGVGIWLTRKENESDSSGESPIMNDQRDDGIWDGGSRDGGQGGGSKNGLRIKEGGLCVLLWLASNQRGQVKSSLLFHPHRVLESQ
jgi:hypothetical protein